MQHEKGEAARAAKLSGERCGSRPGSKRVWKAVAALVHIHNQQQTEVDHLK